MFKKPYQVFVSIGHSGLAMIHQIYNELHLVYLKIKILRQGMKKNQSSYSDCIKEQNYQKDLSISISYTFSLNAWICLNEGIDFSTKL
jgi:hypothetical protein